MSPWLPWWGAWLQAGWPDAGAVSKELHLETTTMGQRKWWWWGVTGNDTGC